MDYSERSLIQIPPHQQLMSDARNSLSGKWGIAVPGYLVYMVVLGVAGIVPFASVLLAGPFALGLAIFALKFARNRDPEISNIFDGFKNFGDALAAAILMWLVIVLGLILFIVPGIILALGLSQTMFILADEPEIGPVEALKKSWEMMKGHKTDYFVLGLRFIPWAFLCLLTFGIGFFWLGPYMQVTFANFYDSLRGAYDDYDPFEDDISKHLVE